MPDIFEIYGWLFKAILVGLGFLILLILAIFIVVGAGFAIYGVGYVAFYALCVGLGVLGLGSPILVPLFIYYAGISESLWFPWLAAISGFFGLVIYSAIIYTHYFEKEDKAKKEESSAEVAAKDKQFFRIARIESPTTEEPPTPQTPGGGR